MARDRSFRRFFVGDAISSFGDWFTYVGVSVLALGQRHDALALAVVLFAQTAPRALLAPIAGALADRVDRRTLLAAAAVARGLAAVAMTIAALAGCAWAVQACYLVRMALGALTDAAARALLPRLVGKASLARANAILGLAWNAMFVVGVAAGGVTIAAGGVAVAFAIDAATFFVAAAVYAALPSAMAVRDGAARVRVRVRIAWTGAATRALLAKVPVSIATGAAWILLNEAAGARAAPGGVAIAIGAVHVARAIGAGVAPLVWPRAWRGTVRGVRVATAIAIVGVAAFSVAHATAGGALACAAVWGIGVGACWVTATTLLQTTMPDACLGRAAAIDVAAQTIAQGVGGVVAAGVSAACGPCAIVGASGCALAVIAWLAIEQLARSRR